MSRYQRLRQSMSVRVRLTIWYVGVLALVLFGFSFGVYQVVAWSLDSGVNTNLSERARQVAASIEWRNNIITVSRLAPTDTDQIRSPIFYRVWNLAGRDTGRFAQISNLDREIEVDPETLAAAQQGIETFVTQRQEGQPAVRLLTVPYRAGDRIVGAVEVGQSLGDMERVLQTLATMLAIGVGISLGVALLGGAFIADRALRPIDQMTRRARNITAQDLHQRLGVPHTDDEIGRLAATLDDLIARLDDAFERQTRFAGDASHELRTPLAILASSVDLALDRERTPDEYREALVSIRQDVDRMTKLVSDLLSLARADAEQQPLHFETLESDGLIAGVVDSLRPLAEERDIRLEQGGLAEVSIPGDETRLTQLLLNLIDNAIKYTGAGGVVTVRSRIDKQQLRIEVHDTGIGIPLADQGRIFERFYRVNKGRSRADGGTGLGLSIVRWIAEAHQGSVTVISQPNKGSTFIVRLPLAVTPIRSPRRRLPLPARPA